MISSTRVMCLCCCCGYSFSSLHRYVATHVAAVSEYATPPPLHCPPHSLGMYITAEILELAGNEAQARQRAVCVNRHDIEVRRRAVLLFPLVVEALPCMVCVLLRKVIPRVQSAIKADEELKVTAVRNIESHIHFLDIN